MIRGIGAGVACTLTCDATRAPWSATALCALRSCTCDLRCSTSCSFFSLAAIDKLCFFSCSTDKTLAWFARILLAMRDDLIAFSRSPERIMSLLPSPGRPHGQRCWTRKCLPLFLIHAFFTQKVAKDSAGTCSSLCAQPAQPSDRDSGRAFFSASRSNSDRTRDQAPAARPHSVAAPAECGCGAHQ